MMLPSKGYFSPLPCPYHDSGECLRPHCHYRHTTKKDKSANSPSSLPSNPNQRTQKGDNDVSSIQAFVISNETPEESPLIRSPAHLINADFESSSKDFSEVPSYKPTPIAELNKRHIPVVYAPTKPSSIVRKKEVKESLLYLPRSISKCASSTLNNAYIPSSSGSGISNSYTYQPSKITSSAYSINDCKSLLKDNVFVNEEEKLLVLDKLIDEEFGTNYESVSFNNNKIHQVDVINSNNQVERTIVEPVTVDNLHITENVISKSSDSALIQEPSKTQIKCLETIKTDAIAESLPEKNNSILEKKAASCDSNNENNNGLSNDFSPKNSQTKNESVSKLSKESKPSLDVKSNTHKKVEKSKYKSSSQKRSEGKDSEKSNVFSDSKIKHSSSDKEHSKSKHASSTTGSVHSKPKSSSSHKSNDSSKTKNPSKEKLEHSKSKLSSSKHVEQTKSKHGSCHKHQDNTKSKHSSSKVDIDSKPKSNSSTKNEDSLKENNSKRKKSNKEHYKGQNHNRRPSDHESKNENQSRSSSHKKCRKKEKDEEVGIRLYKSRDLSSPPPKKIMKIELSSDEYDDNEPDECASSSTDVQEVVNDGETIIIDSSSNSSDSNYLDGNSGVNSASNSPPTSPSPPKKMKLRDEEKYVPSLTGMQSILCERWRKARETVLLKSSVPGKIKISQVPNVKNILNAKDELFAKAHKRPKKHPAPSLCMETKIMPHEEYVPKPATRIAHRSNEAKAQYPSIKIEDNLHVPVAARQSCLNNIFDEYKKYLSPTKAVDQAYRICATSNMELSVVGKVCNKEKAIFRDLHAFQRAKNMSAPSAVKSMFQAVKKEFEICQRSKVTKTYQSACALAVLRIRKTQGQDDEDMSVKIKKHLKSDSITEYTHGWTLYRCFQKYLLTDEELISNGFPIPLESYKGCAYIDKTARRYQNKQPNEKYSRNCQNCSKQYYVNKKGFPLTENDCFYHWGKLRKIKARGGLTEIYICCGADAGSEPCSNGRYHVSNTYDEDCLEGFVTTLPLSSKRTLDKAGIYALDCEMIYTTKGIDLARCTLVDIDGEMVYDKFVIPDHPVLDYCTRFSGVTEIDLKEATLKLKDVQQELLAIINDKTIIVGHSLENDMKVLRLFHKSIVDTSVTFPHARGPPFKRALKHVAKDILNINIQDQETGHDSKEDANTCMQIMLWKVKEDAKGRKPRVIISLGPKGTS